MFVSKSKRRAGDTLPDLAGVGGPYEPLLNLDFYESTDWHFVARLEGSHEDDF